MVAGLEEVKRPVTVRHIFVNPLLLVNGLLNLSTDLSSRGFMVMLRMVSEAMAINLDRNKARYERRKRSPGPSSKDRLCALKYLAICAVQLNFVWI